MGALDSGMEAARATPTGLNQRTTAITPAQNLRAKVPNVFNQNASIKDILYQTDATCPRSMAHVKGTILTGTTTRTRTTALSSSTGVVWEITTDLRQLRSAICFV